MFIFCQLIALGSAVFALSPPIRSQVQIVATQVMATLALSFSRVAVFPSSAGEIFRIGPLGTARKAMSASVRNEQVISIVWVALWTMGFYGVVLSSQPSPYILAVGHRLKVRWIDTRAVAAHMIEFKSWRDRACKQLVGHAMRLDVFFTIPTDPIPIHNAGVPYPAAG